MWRLSHPALLASPSFAPRVRSPGLHPPQPPAHAAPAARALLTARSVCSVRTASQHCGRPAARFLVLPPLPFCPACLAGHRTPAPGAPSGDGPVGAAGSSPPAPGLRPPVLRAWAPRREEGRSRHPTGLCQGLLPPAAPSVSLGTALPPFCSLLALPAGCWSSLRPPTPVTLSQASVGRRKGPGTLGGLGPASDPVQNSLPPVVQQDSRPPLLPPALLSPPPTVERLSGARHCEAVVHSPPAQVPVASRSAFL